jgi:hypothetical protein
MRGSGARTAGAAHGLGLRLRRYARRRAPRRDHEFGDKPWIANTLVALGAVSRDENDFESATTHLREALAILQEIRESKTIALAQALGIQAAPPSSVPQQTSASPPGTRADLGRSLQPCLKPTSSDSRMRGMTQSVLARMRFGCSVLEKCNSDEIPLDHPACYLDPR